MKILILLLLLLLLVGCAWMRKRHPCEPRLTPAVHPRLQLRRPSNVMGVQCHVHQHTLRDVLLLEELAPGWIRLDFDFPTFLHPAAPLGGWSIPVVFASTANRGNGHVIFTLSYGDRAHVPFMDSQSYQSDLRNAVEFFRQDTRVAWEMWNEPNHPAFGSMDAETYFGYAAPMIELIREVDPTACVLGPACAGIDRPFLKRLFELGYLELIDGLTVHPYRDKPPETLIADLRDLRRLMCETAGFERPILIGEIGYGKLDPVTQGEYLQDTMMVGVVEQCPAVIWYQFRAAGPGGMVSDSFEPRPAFDAFMALHAVLEGKQFVSRP